MNRASIAPPLSLERRALYSAALRRALYAELDAEVAAARARLSAERPLLPVRGVRPYPVRLGPEVGCCWRGAGRPRPLDEGETCPWQDAAGAARHARPARWAAASISAIRPIKTRAPICPSASSAGSSNWPTTRSALELCPAPSPPHQARCRRTFPIGRPDRSGDVRRAAWPTPSLEPI